MLWKTTKRQTRRRKRWQRRRSRRGRRTRGTKGRPPSYRRTSPCWWTWTSACRPTPTLRSMSGRGRRHGNHTDRVRDGGGNECLFCPVFRYYDHKRTAAKKEQKTVEAAEKVNDVKQMEGNVFTIHVHFLSF